MKKQDDTGIESRRRFLKTMAATGGAVAVTAGLGGTASASAPEETTSEVSSEPRGYHETQHIRDYYARADF